MEKQKMSLQILFLAILIFPVVHGSGCRRECGGIDVPYPFELNSATPECYRDPSFKLFCNDTFTPSRLFAGSLSVHSLSVADGTAKAELFTSGACYNASTINPNRQIVDLRESPFTLSSTHNKFTVLGCNTLGFISVNVKRRFATGCVALCNPEDIANYDRSNYPKYLNTVTSCLGSGCCQTPIPEGLKTLYTAIQRIDRKDEEFTFSGCSFGFLGDQDEFHVYRNPERILSSLAVLDWAIGNTTYDENTALCGAEAHSINSSTGIGYRCSCNQGFAGNPYNLSTGCQDIDECSPINRINNTCHGTCKNIPGNYICHCSFGHQGDGKLGSCTLKTVIKVMIGIGCCIIITAVTFPSCWMYKKRIHDANQRRNGGLLLERLSVKIYKEEQLEKATNYYDSGNLLDKEGSGSVYMGKEENKREIVVKKSNTADQKTMEQFLNQVNVVSKINHKNVVKLLGICLETKVPMLVYEFIPGGTLYERIHGNGKETLYSWPVCLKIASETAGALAYMHSAADPPIVHRDIKTKNILLHGTTAKVADFGASMLISVDQSTTSRPVQGTIGYCDPEYLQTGELTVQSDVYGFGVVLMELLCKQKPLYRGVSGETVSFVKVFTTAVEENRIDRVLKFNDVYELELNQVHTVANLAVKCMKMVGNDRPTMTEVANLLQGLCREYNSFQVEGDDVEKVKLGDEEFHDTPNSWGIE